jgi:flagellar biosynthetic protein FliQ
VRPKIIKRWFDLVTPELAITLNNEMVWTAILLALPVLGLSTLVGLFISILQVVTQVQDISLTFVPKMLTVALTMVAFGPWMIGVMVEFARTLIGNIPAYF